MATQIKVNTRTLQRIMRGEVGRLREDIDRRADRILQAAGPGYSAEGWVGRFRYRQNVHTDRPIKTSAASPLLRAVDAGRGNR